jgi:hypothetical protein
MSFVWSQAAVSLLQRFYVEQGLSAAQTAGALGRELGGAPTRNAVLGKAQRLGWLKPAAERPAEPPPPPIAKVRRGPVRWPRPLADCPLPPLREVRTGAPPKLWTERGRFECAYPVGDPAGPGLQMCCAAPTGGATYCPPHRDLMAQANSAMTEHDLEAIVAIARRAA